MEKKKIYYILGVITLLLFFSFLFFSAPTDFVPGSIVKVEKGTSLRGVSYLLKSNNIIRSRTVFEALVIFFGGEKRIRYSEYLFEDELPVYDVARRIVRGEHQMAPIIVTIPEGFDVDQIADAFSLKLENFSKEQFLLQAKPKEGYLFPDTYFFFSVDNEKDVLASMSSNFEKKMEPFRPLIAALDKKTASKTESEIIIMASIIEREAKGDADRGFISGILWKRLGIGMPLQVDAVPSTYNTKGLQKSPIANPGLMSIKTAIYPEESPYLYYLHDKEGKIHYAKNFTEHKANIAKYLK